MINYDLETSPLELKTNSKLGSNRRLEIRFLSSPESPSGGLRVDLTSPPFYTIIQCTNKKEDLTILSETCPTVGDSDIWRITLNRYSASEISDTRLGITVHCNDREMMEVVISREICQVAMNLYSKETIMITFWHIGTDLVYRHRPLAG